VGAAGQHTPSAGCAKTSTGPSTAGVQGTGGGSRLVLLVQCRLETRQQVDIVLLRACARLSAKQCQATSCTSQTVSGHQLQFTAVLRSP
jgi:hypothetical protein